MIATLSVTTRERGGLFRAARGLQASAEGRPNAIDRAHFVRALTPSPRGRGASAEGQGEERGRPL